MNPIIICEDDPMFLQQMVTLMNNYILFHEGEFKLDFYTQDPRDLVLYLDQEQPKQGVYFLDIDLSDDMDGIDLAEQVRLKDPLSKIVFVTSHEDYAGETIARQIEPFAYLVKGRPDKMRDAIYATLTKAHERLIGEREDKQANLTVTMDHKTYQIKLDDVLLIETTEVPHRLRLHTKQPILSRAEDLYFYSSLKQIQEQYPDRFVRISRPMLANPDEIIMVDRREKLLRLSNGLERPYSIKYQRFILQKISEKATVMH